MAVRINVNNKQIDNVIALLHRKHYVPMKTKEKQLFATTEKDCVGLFNIGLAAMQKQNIVLFFSVRFHEIRLMLR